MLIQLEPEQVNSMWADIKPMIYENMPPGYEDLPKISANILTSILCRDCVVWGYYSDDGLKQDFNDQPKPLRGICITSVVHTPVLRVKRLLLFTYYVDSELGRQNIVEGIRTLEEYASSKGCADMYAYSENEVFTRMMRAIGWNTDQIVIRKNID